jgi:hypothetical protein
VNCSHIALLRLTSAGGLRRRVAVDSILWNFGSDLLSQGRSISLIPLRLDLIRIYWFSDLIGTKFQLSTIPSGLDPIGCGEKEKKKRLAPAPRDRTGLPPSASSPRALARSRKRLWPSGPARLRSALTWNRLATCPTRARGIVMRPRLVSSHWQPGALSLGPAHLQRIARQARLPPDSLRPPATRGTGVPQLCLLPISAKREREKKHVELIASDQTSEFLIDFRVCDFSRRIFLPTGAPFL